MLKQLKNNLYQPVVIMSILAIGFSSCAKKPEYEELTKDKDMITITSAIDTESEYLYVPMSLGAPRAIIDAFSYFQGTEKIVKLKMTEDGITAFEVDPDDKFSDNPLNNSMVFTIPGKYSSFKCAENNFDECTNREEEDTDKEWYEKEYFTPDFKNLDTHSLNADYWAIGSECIHETGKRVVSKELRAGVINVHLEKSFEVSKSQHCLSQFLNLHDIKDTAFKAQFHFSLVKLSDVISKNYEVFKYEVEDKTTFGFFDIVKSELDDQFTNNGSYKKEERIMERWNPKREKIVYYLSETFNKPQNKLLKKATFESIESINNGLEKAGVKFRLELREPNKNINIGDLRYNMINLLDEPLANGLLGYGPSVSNPRTGEIIKAHTNMYSGVIKTSLRHYWEQMVSLQEEKVKEDAEMLAFNRHNSLRATRNIRPSNTHVHNHDHDHDHGHGHGHDDAEEIFDHDVLDQAISQGSGKTLFADTQKWSKLNKVASMRSAKIKDDYNRHIKRFKKGVKSVEDYMALENERLQLFAEHNAFSVEFLNVKKTVKAIFPKLLDVQGIFKKNSKSLKGWNELTSEQRKSVEDVIVPFVYKSTLVHELGHNIGLRHNFAGSWDKKNWFTEKEAKENGYPYIPESSSVMDYVSSNFGELNVLGKYDVAALRYGYAGKVETKSGKLIEVGKSLSSLEKKLKEKRAKIKKKIEESAEVAALSKELEDHTLKTFEFCTDENAGASLECNRHDEGTSLTEITQSIIKNYKDSYRLSNFRNGRSVFNVGRQMISYLLSRYNSFEKIRAVFEEWESYVQFLGLPVMTSGCSPQHYQDPGLVHICNMIRDRIVAAKNAGEFFLEILKTPDHTCALTKEQGSNKISELRKLHEIYENNRQLFDSVPTTCFNSTVKEIVENEDIKLYVHSEGGKFLNGIRDYAPNFKSTYDRAVFGTWIDKILAMKGIVQRYSSMTANVGSLNFLSHPTLGKEITSYISHLIIQTPLQNPVPFQMEDGLLAIVPYSIDNTYVIKTEDLPMAFSWARDFLSIDDRPAPRLRAVLLENAKKFDLIIGKSAPKEARDLINMYSVRRISDSDTYENKTIKSFTSGGISFGATEDNQFALAVIESLNSIKFLKEQGKEKVAKIIEKRTKVPEGSPEGAQDLVDRLMIDNIEYLIQLKRDGILSDEEEIKKKYGHTSFFDLFMIAHRMTLSELESVVTIKTDMLTAPEGADEATLRLYDLDLTILNNFVSGVLEKSIPLLMETLEDLPNHVYPRLD